MAKQNDVDLPQQGDAIRRFNRFYTRAIGTHTFLAARVPWLKRGCSRKSPAMNVPRQRKLPAI